MREKVIIFLVGLLMGAIISTGSIYVYSTFNNNDMRMNEPNDKGQGGMIDNNGTPPEIPTN